MDSGMLQNHQLWAFWCWCLMKASHKPTRQMVGWQEVKLMTGQFVFGRKKAAQQLGLSEQTVRTCISLLKSMGNITMKSTNKFSIITIVNWDTYQGSDQLHNHQTNQQVTSSQPTNNHKQESQNTKNVNKSPIGDSFPESGPETPPAISRCPHNEIKKLYHDELPELSPIRVWGDASRKNLTARWREDHERQSPEWWRNFFREHVRTSDFLMGRRKDWQANLDWIVKSKNFHKIMNGLYANNGNGRQPNRPENPGCRRGVCNTANRNKDFDNLEVVYDV